MPWQLVGECAWLGVNANFRGKKLVVKVRKLCFCSYCRCHLERGRNARLYARKKRQLGEVYGDILKMVKGRLACIWNFSCGLEGRSSHCCEMGWRPLSDAGIIDDLLLIFVFVIFFFFLMFCRLSHSRLVTNFEQTSFGLPKKKKSELLV